MRAFLGLLLILPLLAYSPFPGENGFGARLVPAACIAEAAPWILADAAGMPSGTEAGLQQAPALRAVTYNLHSGFGPRHAFFRSRAAIERHLTGIAAVIAALPEAVDLVGLNEVDFAARRSGGIDQARYLAQALEHRTGERYEVIYGETWRRRLPGFEARFGNAALVRHPVLSSSACLYDDARNCDVVEPGAGMPPLRAGGVVNRLVRESRGFIKLTFEMHGRPVDAIVTHLDAFVLAEREAQAAHLLRRFIDPARTTVVLGDVNTVPTVMTYTRAFFAADRTHDILTSGSLADARVLYDSRNGRSDFGRWATFPASAPVWPLDAVLGSIDLVPRDVKVIESMHSDHHGLYVEYRLARRAAVIAEQRRRHDAIRGRQLAQIVRCDLAHAGAAQLRWLMGATGFMDVISSTEREALLLQMGPRL